jgi:hypothetical protein
MEEGFVHVIQCVHGQCSAELIEDLAEIDESLLVGAKPPAVPANIFTLVGWSGYQELNNQHLVRTRPFVSWNEVSIFQKMTGGWCYLQLVAQTPNQAARIVMMHGMTMDWDSIIALGQLAGTMNTPFEVRITSKHTSHINMLPGGNLSLNRVLWFRQNPNQTPSKYSHLLGRTYLVSGYMVSRNIRKTGPSSRALQSFP